MNVACPTCGAGVEFRYDDSFVRVCGHCRSAVVRGDRGVETLGRFADLVPIASPLRLFAEGRYGTAGFLLIGMAQLQHGAGGLWQEWYARLDGGQWAWISEAQGRLYLTFERPDVAVPSIAQLAPGVPLMLAGTVFTVAERGAATYVSALGEIPYRLVPSATFQFVDLLDGRGGFATIDYGDGSEPPAVYIGYQIAPQALGLSGGEAPAPAGQGGAPVAGRRLACPNCNGSLELRAPDQSLRVACPYCGTLVSVESGALSIIARQATKPRPAIPLGATGKLLDGKMTVIGYLGRSAQVDGEWYPFEEYLLHAPGVGFRWLVCSDGHWSYVQPIATGAVELRAGASGIAPAAAYDGVAFRAFQASPLRVDCVLGELYWRVEVGERVHAEDYIAPPAMLSREVSASEQNWSLSRYLTRDEVIAAFGGSLSLPPPIGVAPNQPYPAAVGKVMAVFTVALLALGAGKCASASATEKLQESFAIPTASARVTPKIDTSGGSPQFGPLTPAAPAIGSDGTAGEATGSVMFSQVFQLEAGKNVAFELVADLRNNWMYAVIDLIHDDTGSVVSFDKAMEFYSGADSDGAWSEGSNTADAVLGPVAAGNYVLRVEAQHGGAEDIALRVRVRQGVFRPPWFWIAFAVLAIPFGLVAWSGRAFHRRRWSNSNLPELRS